MTKKKRGHPDIEEVLARPWCYYCERDFDDLKILISHQKAKHFKCERCGRRLNTAGGLSVHMNQVHKETLGAVENALPNRSNLDVEIFGMEGIPEDIVQQHNQRVLSQFQQAELEHRANSGNPAPGGANAGTKKPKFESPSELKKRLAEHKAKKAAQEAAGGSSGDATPIGAGQGVQSPGLSKSPGPYQQPPQQPLQQFPNHQGNSSQSPFPQPYGQPSYPYPPQQPQYAQPSPSFPPGAPGFPQPIVPHFTTTAGPYQANAAFSPNGASFPNQYNNTFPSSFPGQPPVPVQQNHQPSPLPQSNAIPQRPPGLPAAPGLPQRPSVAAPAVNAFQMQQLHQVNPPNPNQFGASGFATTSASDTTQDPRIRSANSLAQTGHASQPGQSEPSQPSIQQVSTAASSVDDLIASAAKDSQAAEAKLAEPEVNGEKKIKKEKDKDKPTKLVYSDNEVSPEEKMAQMPRYAFVPDSKKDTVLGNAVDATMTEVIVN